VSYIDALVDAPEYGGLRERWWQLALGVAVHRYFLHVDRALEADTGLDFKARLALTQPAGSADWLKLQRRYALVEAPPPRPATSILTHGPLGAISSLGALGLAAGPGATPSWYGVMGLLHEDDNAQARAIRNVFLGFLYAERRQSGDKLPLPELASAIAHEYGAMASAVERCARTNGLHAETRDRELIENAAASLECMPAAEFALTLCRSRRIWEHYASGLGLGQS
jgi:hypothetical protein